MAGVEPREWDVVLAGDTSPDLKVLAARQLAWINTTEVAPKVVQHVCRFRGPFDGFEGISRTRHAEVLFFLAEINPEAVARRIEGFLDDLGNLLKVGGDVRRHLVFALEKIAFHHRTFEVGAHLLLRLAVAENKTWDNNASGQFKALFPCSRAIPRPMATHGSPSWMKPPKPTMQDSVRSSSRP